MIQASKAILFCAVIVTNCFKDEAAQVILKPDTISGLSHSQGDPPCGNWTPFINEKCIKLIVKAGLQTKNDGEHICRAFAKQFYGAEIPKLITIKTPQEQKFLQRLLFEDLAILDNVWLGLELEKDDLFHWNDRTDLLFTNWVDGSINVSDRRCVQMESGEGAYEKGKLVRVNCKKRNVIVCERTQPWSTAALQNILLSLKLEVARNKEEAEQKLSESNQKINEANQMIRETSREIESLKKDPVPLGFIYVQLPGQDPPTTLWPQTSWKNVGSDYAGLFFRVEGGYAAPFGELQEDNTRRLAQVAHNLRTTWITAPEIPENGSWSQFTFGGSNGKENYGLTFRLTPGEIRPQNNAVRIWRRMK